jgi:hypothetical protein
MSLSVAGEKPTRCGYIAINVRTRWRCEEIEGPWSMTGRHAALDTGDKNVVGQTRDYRWACGARGWRNRLSLQAFALAIVVHRTLSENCTIAVSEADWEIKHCTNCVRCELYWWAFKPSPAPNPSRFSGCPRALGKSAVQPHGLHGYTATQPQI